MNSAVLKSAIGKLVKDSDNGVLATDIIDTRGGMPIVGYNSNPKASALFNRIFDQLIKSLAGSGFDTELDYYYLKMKNNQAVIVGNLSNPKYRFGMLVDLNQVQLGMMLNVLLPEYLDNIKDAL